MSENQPIAGTGVRQIAIADRPISLLYHGIRASRQRRTGSAVVNFICSMAKHDVMLDNPSVWVISFL